MPRSSNSNSATSASLITLAVTLIAILQLFIMHRLSLPLALLIFVLVACKNKTTSDDQLNNKETTPLTSSSNTPPKVISLVAEPATINIDASKTAVIVVDMENDFGAKGGMFDRAGLDIVNIQKVVKPTAAVLSAAREAGMKIIYLKMGFKPDLSDLGTEGSPNRVRHQLYMHVGDSITAPNGRGSRILVRDSWGTSIVPELQPEKGDIELYKTRFSGFYKTALDSTLKQLGVTYLIVTGCTTSICVESTVRDAMFRDYSAIVLRDCVAEPAGPEFTHNNHETSLYIMQRMYGWVSSSTDFINGLGTQEKRLQ